ncbi:SDR family oxidoreductase [Taibaiella lutea]|uniref:dTDP-4-dehydrorhamnose reductase n=1 Tax=Taibaiella lutea TaxID=2608001 RepID=A0A5M6CH79_9BACT|nr:SDR family oxidoreductase [Taibaiella lutea]KAA5533780.1 SDR family oxidoreductase [Taibaiella lutea]
MEKVLVIGAKGMAGHVVKTYLETTGRYEVWGIARNINESANEISLDVSREKELEDVIKKHQFDYVINCIGILNKDAEDNPYKAIWYNSYFPHLLEKWGAELRFKLIHISTDCVFSGKGNGGYTESSFKDGIGYYAQSKALGEVDNDKDLTIRTSIVGPELKSDGIGLFHWFMQQEKPIKGYVHAYWSGVTTIVLAQAIDQAIQQNLKGLFQLTNNQKISKFDLISLFNNQFRGGKLEISPDANYKVDKSLVSTRNDFDFKVPDYETMVLEMNKWMQQHQETYRNYK